MQCRQFARPGLTLVEMLITVGLLGAATAVGLPKVNDTIRQRRVMAASAAVAADLESGFSLAARQRRPVRLTYDATSGELRIADRATGTIYRRRPLRGTSEYHLDGASIYPTAVDLFPNGLSSSAFVVTLINGAYQRRVTVSRSGLTRVVVP